MPKPAIEKLMMCLRGAGPAILRGTYFDQSGKKDAPRLQGPADARHQGENDPHKDGRALDIILFSTIDSERDLADRLVAIFLDLRKDMQWSAVIYNRRQWNSEGVESKRVWTKGTKEDPYSFEHISHIHIQWSKNKADISDFWLGLVLKLDDEFKPRTA
jgi:hypothetical protein